MLWEECGLQCVTGAQLVSSIVCEHYQETREELVTREWQPCVPFVCVCVCVWYRGLNPGAFYLRAVPPALFFILYFETTSHEVTEDLTK